MGVMVGEQARNGDKKSAEESQTGHPGQGLHRAAENEQQRRHDGEPERPSEYGVRLAHQRTRRRRERGDLDRHRRGFSVSGDVPFRDPVDQRLFRYRDYSPDE